MACSDNDDAGTKEAVAGEAGQGGSSSTSGGKSSGGSSVLPDAGGAGGDDSDAGASSGGAPVEARYVLSSIAFSEEASSTYLSLLDSLDIETVDFTKAREFPGSADLWLHEGSIYVSEFDSLTMTRFGVKNGALVEGDKVSFANYGLTDFGFWVNAFVAPDKAYIANGVAEYVIWNPEEMVIEGAIEVPELPAQGTLEPFFSYSDRSVVLRDGLLYHPAYYTDDTFFEYAPVSSIVVTDVATDEVVDVLEAPCPGIDFATQDEDGNIYFSSWVYAPGGAALLDQPTTCVAKIAAGSDTVTKLFDFPDVTEGRQGGALRYLGGGKALMAVLHDERSDSEDVAVVAFGGNWQFWLYDFAEGSAAPVESIDFNAGAAYDANIHGVPHLLVPAGDYTSTQLFELGADGTARARLKSQGWSLRVFALD